MSSKDKRHRGGLRRQIAVAALVVAVEACAGASPTRTSPSGGPVRWERHPTPKHRPRVRSSTSPPSPPSHRRPVVTPSAASEREAFFRALNGDSGSSKPVDVIDATGAHTGVVVSVGNGCRDQGNVHVFGSVDAYLQFTADDVWLQTLATQAVDEVRSAPATEQATARWRVCMSAVGYDYASPLTMLAVDWGPRRPTAHEIEVANADVHCHTSSGYAAAVIAEDATAQQRVLEQYGAVLADVLARRTSTIDRLAGRIGVTT